MDYDINLTTLESKQTEFDTMKSNVEDIYNEFSSCYLNKLSGTEISSLSSKIKKDVDRLKNGYKNSSTWLTN